MTTDTLKDTTERTLVIERLLDAPREMVWKVWTDPKHLVHWWGPKDFTVPHHAIDLRAGGSYRIGIRSAKGNDYIMRGVYREVAPPARLVFTFAWEDENGAPVHETLVTVTFEEVGNQTRFTFHQALFRHAQERDDHNDGWSECFDRLVAYLNQNPTPGDPS